MSLFVRPLAAADLLLLWEHGDRQHPVVLAMELLGRALPGTAAQELWDLPVGQRDRLLLQLREQTFGPQLSLAAACPKCQERLELGISIPELQASAKAEIPATDGEVTIAEYQIAFRLPTSSDLWAAAVTTSRAAALQELLARCVTAAHGDQEVAIADLPEEVLEALSAHMVAVDPQTETLFGLQCPACGHGWQAALDVARLLLKELATEAERLLEEVHTLASAYGWSERDIVAMSGKKRRAYLSRWGVRA